MSIKITIKHHYDDGVGGFHLYRECFEEDNAYVYLELDGVLFRAANTPDIQLDNGLPSIAFRIPADWARKLGLIEGGEITGSSFDSWLKEEGIHEEVTANAIKRVGHKRITSTERYLLAASAADGQEKVSEIDFTKPFYKVHSDRPTGQSGTDTNSQEEQLTDGDRSSKNEEHVTRRKSVTRRKEWRAASD